MKYEELVNVYESLADTTKRLEKTEVLANYFKILDDETLSMVTLLALGKVFPFYSEEEMGVGDKLVMRAISESVGIGVDKVEDQVREQGDIGAACEKLFTNKKQQTFFSQPLTIKFVFNNLRKLAKISGNKSNNKKIAIILELLSSASPTESKYIVRTITDELRIGVGEGIIRDAISQGFDVDKAITERAYMLTNDLGLVAKVSKNQGEEGLKKLSLQPGKPVKPMLAQLSPGIKESIKEMGEALCETKYDGIRMQVHKNNGEIKVYTRRLENITKSVPEVVTEIDKAFPNENFIAEGEIIAIRDGKPLSFQNILRRVRRKYDIDEAINSVPLKVYLYDLLYYKKPLIDEPIKERRAILEDIVNVSDKINLSQKLYATSENVNDAIALFEKSLNEGHEGIMIKNVKEPYIPGIRGKKMLKFKAEPETLEVGVVGGTH